MPVDKEKKLKFNTEVAKLKKKAEEVYKIIKDLESKGEVEEENLNLLKVRMAEKYLDLVSIYVGMSDLSMSLLEFKNESYLDMARKCLYKAIIILEEVVSNTVDMPLTENYELLKSLEGITDSEKLRLIRKIGYSISLLEDRYGESSKWKWSFVELRGRYAVVAKNLFNFREYQEKNDPRIEGFEERYDYLFLVKELLVDASNRYREKYELTNHTPDDMKKAIDLLRALKRIHLLFKEQGEVQNVSKRIELWAQKLETDMKAKEKLQKEKLSKDYIKNKK